MKRWILLAALCLLPGCDVATVALIMGGQDGGSSDDGPALPSPGPVFGDEFRVWIGNIPDGAAALAEQQDLIDADGVPSAAVWTFLASLTATEIFDPDNANLPAFNAILIQAYSEEHFRLDCVEILDAQGTVLEHASGVVYSNLVTDENNIIGPPDGKVAVTASVAPQHAFLFTMYAGPIDRFQINGYGTTQPIAPGDIVAVGDYQSFSAEIPGGMAIDANGLVHITLSVGDTGRLVRYDLSGVIPAPTADHDALLNADLATAGSHSVALNSAGVVFTSCSVGSGLVQVRRFDAANLAAGNSAAFASGFNSDRVEHNSIAVDGSGFVIVVGGMNTLIQGRNHWMIKLPDTITDPPVWQNTSNLDQGNPTTYWHAVATGADDDLFLAGDLNSGLLGTIQVYTARFDSDRNPQWDEAFDQADTPADMGHAIGLDNAGNVYVGGMVGTDADGKDGVLLRYTSDGAKEIDTLIGGFGAVGGDDEILDIAVNPADGSVYAVGYETVAGQGENIVVRKFVKHPQAYYFEPVWARTHHGGFGNDRAVSCAIHQNNLVVAGYETNNTGQTKFVLRVYEK